MPRSACPFPGPLAKAARRFQRWRKYRSGHRIPDPLWEIALALAKSFGLAQTTRALGLNYETLKKRLQAQKKPGPAPSPVPPEFVEILPSSNKPGQLPALSPAFSFPPTSPAPTPPCLLELLRPDGMQFRVHLPEAQALDLASLTREFWGGRP
jgi:hypothetical protein